MVDSVGQLLQRGSALNAPAPPSALLAPPAPPKPPPATEVGGSNKKKLDVGWISPGKALVFGDFWMISPENPWIFGEFS